MDTFTFTASVPSQTNERIPVHSGASCIECENCRTSKKGGNMTQLQIAYQQLLETQRANRAKEALTAEEVKVKQKEAGIKATEAKTNKAKVALTEREVALKEAKAGYEIDELIASMNLKDKQSEQSIANTAKILADREVSVATEQKVLTEIGEIASSTALNKARKKQVLQDIQVAIADKDVKDATVEKLVAETNKFVAEIPKVEAEIKKIEEDTTLTKVEQKYKMAETVRSLVSSLDTWAHVGVNGTQAIRNLTGAFNDVVKTINPLNLILGNK